MPELFTDRHAKLIRSTLRCLDRVVITGTLPGICYAHGMATYLSARRIRIFDYPKWAEPLRDEIRANAEAIAAENDIEIEFVRKKNLRKEDRVAQIINARGDHPGLVCILSAMESCSTYKPWHDKRTHRTFLKPDTAQCLHYYFYFIDEMFGLCYLRVPTWAPFRLQFYFNGHNLLANQLRRTGIGYALLDNAFVEIADSAHAQQLADSIDVKQLHRLLDRTAARYCPVIRHFETCYHWSLMQVEYATDILFCRQRDLDPIYEDLVRTAVHSVKPDRIATFLSRKLTDGYTDEMGNDFTTRIQGTSIKHHMGPAAIKMYNKFSILLRIETVVNDVTFFKHHRMVEHRNGTRELKLAPMKKSIYSLPDLVELMSAANRRYLEFISAIDDPTPGINNLDKISRPARDNHRTYRGFNLFHGDDLALFRTLSRGEFFISGFRNSDLRRHLDRGGRQVSAILKRLRIHGIVKKVGRTYKYYLTSAGKLLIATAQKLTEMSIIPLLRGQLAN